ncbi:MAG: HIT domain-containing protein [Acidimicrobiales bacterium]|nr:HIT domain-containing protein [Acidimicrobiales bacterium]
MTSEHEPERCIFCEIVAGRLPASVFYEDEWTLGFMDIAPVNAGHALIIPKRHAVGLGDLDPEDGRRIWDVTHRTAVAVRSSGVRCEGVNLFLADGRAAFQEVFHVHMHVVPRFVGDPFRIDLGRRDAPPREQLDDTATRIRSQM